MGIARKTNSKWQGRRKTLPAEVRLCLHHISKKHCSLESKGRDFQGKLLHVQGVWGIHGPTEGREEPTPLTCSLVHGLLLRSCRFGFSSPKTSRALGMWLARALGMSLTSSEGRPTLEETLEKPNRTNHGNLSHFNPNHGKIRELFRLEETPRIKPNLGLILLH